MSIRIGQFAHSSIHSPTLDAMYRFRHQVFVDRLNWDVPLAGAAGRETDDYDDEASHYIVAMLGSDCVGCWRARPTTGRYMLRDSFSVLLDEEDAPEDASIWELSRFAVKGGKENGYGFSSTTRQMFHEIHDFAKRHAIDHFVTVTSLAIERMLRSAGVTCKRIGVPARMGAGMAVAIRLLPEELGRIGVAGTFD
ncbi:acyl-homoserine-lactone synthase [Paraburkholderia sp.]|jgi:acyl homoserine lactone synthase|uniref:acyl-homoserine-lactone synthase n=1 Tax=Paraburkholderia sp. TaxID=1926495 RepID=UPI003C46575A